MLKKDIKEFDKNIFTDLDKTWGIVTAGDKTIGCNSMTISWGGIGVLWGINVGIVYIRKSRYTYEFAKKSESFTISFLSDKYKKEKALFGSKSGRDIDKYEATGLHKCYEPDYDGYYIAEADYVLKMKKIYELDIPYDKLPDNLKERYYPDGDMHTMFVCKITHYLEKE